MIENTENSSKDADENNKSNTKNFLNLPVKVIQTVSQDELFSKRPNLRILTDLSNEKEVKKR